MWASWIFLVDVIVQLQAMKQQEKYVIVEFYNFEGTKEINEGKFSNTSAKGL